MESLISIPSDSASFSIRQSPAISSIAPCRSSNPVKLPSISSMSFPIKHSPTESEGLNLPIHSYLNSGSLPASNRFYFDEMLESEVNLSSSESNVHTRTATEAFLDEEHGNNAKLVKLEESAAVSPGGSSVSSDRIPLEWDKFDYCENCTPSSNNLENYAGHLIAIHLKPRKLPSSMFDETKDRNEDVRLRPYTTLYPSKKRKPGSGKPAPRPQNQYMIFSNYVRTPLMKYFGEVNHAQISQTISTMWKRLTESEKLPFKEESKRCEELHKIEFPYYKYQPKQKKTVKKTEVNIVSKKGPISPQEMSDASPADSSAFYEIGSTNIPHTNGGTGHHSSGHTFLSTTGVGGDEIKTDILMYSSNYQTVNDTLTIARTNNDFNLPTGNVSYPTYTSAQSNSLVSSIIDINPGQSPGTSLSMYLKRDPVLSQNSAPQLTNDSYSCVTSSWNNANAPLSGPSPTLGLLQNAGQTQGSLSSQLMAADSPSEEMPLSSSAPNDFGSNITSDTKLLTYSSIANNQTIDPDHARDLSALGATSLPDFDIHDDANGISEKRELYDSYYSPMDDPMYMSIN